MESVVLGAVAVSAVAVGAGRAGALYTDALCVVICSLLLWC